MEGGDFLHLTALLPGATLLAASLVATSRGYDAENDQDCYAVGVHGVC